MNLYTEALTAGLPPHAARQALYIETLDGPDHARAFIRLASEIGHASAIHAFDAPARSCRRTRRPVPLYAPRPARPARTLQPAPERRAARPVMEHAPWQGAITTLRTLFEANLPLALSLVATRSAWTWTRRLGASPR